MVTVDESHEGARESGGSRDRFPITEMHLGRRIDIKEEGVLFIEVYSHRAPILSGIRFSREDIGMNIRPTLPRNWMGEEGNSDSFMATALGTENQSGLIPD